METITADEYYRRIQKAAEYIKTHLGPAEVAVVLGSGLNNFTNELQNKKELGFSEIPFMPQTTVKGHSGKLVVGTIGGKTVYCLAGRIHAYEGRHMFELTFTARVLGLAGVKLLVATNASGGAMPGMYNGCLMIIKDHINCYKRNPLSDTAELEGLMSRHPDLSELYSKRVAALAKSVAKELNIELFEGVYGGTSGPTYETPNEVVSFSKWGANAFGMSTIPETSAARGLGMEVFAMSLITNLAAGITDEKLTHNAVTNVAQDSAPLFTQFMKSFLGQLTPLPEEVKLPQATSSISDYLGLPQPQAPPVTQQQMKEAVEFVRAKANSKESSIAVILSPEHEEFSKNIQISVEIPFKQIPHFPIVSSSTLLHPLYYSTHTNIARHGKLVLGTVDSVNILCLTGLDLCGFACEEATFFAELLAHLRVTLLLHTFAAGAVNGSHSVNTLLQLRDCIDSTTVHPVPQSIKVPQFNTRVSAFKYEKEDGAGGVYMHFPGPSFPTPAEVHVASLAKCDIAGITSLSIVYAASSCGIQVKGIAEVLWTDKPSQSVKSDGKFAEILLKNIKSYKPSDSIKTPTFTDPSFSRQVTYSLPYPVIMGDYDAVQKDAALVNQTFDNNKSTIALVLESEVKNHVFKDKLVVKKQIAYNQFQYMKEVEGSLQFAELNGVPIYVLNGTAYLNQGLPNSTVTYGIRLLQALGVKKILHLTSICSCDSSSLKVGQLVMLKDHTFLSGRNPLTGINDDRWGERFPDVSDCYCKQLMSNITDSAKELGIECPGVIYTHFTGPLFHSEADALYNKILDIKATTTSLAPEIITAVHMGVNSGAVGVVTAALDSSEETQVPAESFAKAEALISKIISVIASS